jgi:hypothetical protein
MTETNKQQLWILALIPIGFLLTLFVLCPIVKSIWNMLVFPYYHVQLHSGAVIFVSLMANFIKFKPADKTLTFKYFSTKVASFYLSLIMTWGIVYLYKFFI